MPYHVYYVPLACETNSFSKAAASLSDMLSWLSAKNGWLITSWIDFGRSSMSTEIKLWIRSINKGSILPSLNNCLVMGWNLKSSYGFHELNFAKSRSFMFATLKGGTPNESINKITPRLNMSLGPP